MAESVMIAGMFCHIGEEYGRLMEKIGNKQEAERAFREVEKMRKVIMEHGWDGSWFVRAYDDFGRKVGSHENEEGQIFIESQGFCIMGKCGLDDGKAIQALMPLRSVWDQVRACLNNPAFTRYYIEYGEISLILRDIKRMRESSAITMHGL